MPDNFPGILHWKSGINIAASAFMKLTRHFALALAVVATGALSSCSSPEPEVAKDTTLDNRAWWTGDGVEGSRKIVIDLSAQRLRYYKGGTLVGVSPISSGREGRSTLNGNFKILNKDIDHRSSLYGAFVDSEGSIVQEDVDSRKDRAPSGSKFMGASMRYFMRIVGGIGMHEGYLPGYPASHGCIRLPTRMAEIFYNETPEGTPVQVVGHGSLAENEDAVPLGKGEVATAEPDPDNVTDDLDEDAQEKAKAEKKKRETVRRAVVADSGSKEDSVRTARYQSPRELRKKNKRGATMYLE